MTSGYVHMSEDTLSRIVEMRRAGKKLREIAAETGYAQTSISERLSEMGVSKPSKLKGTKAKAYWEPSPEELQERCLAVQGTWSDIERSRREGAGQQSVQIQRVKFGELVGAVRMSEREMAEL